MSERVPRGLLVVSALVFLAAACSSGGAGNGGASTSSTTVTAPGSSTPGSDGSSTTPTTVGGDPIVAGFILSAAPAGLTQVPDTVSDSGPTNLAKAKRDEANAGGSIQLVQSGFVSGYQRMWASGDGVRQDTIFLYRFTSATGAAAYAANRARELNAFPSRAPISTFVVPMPGGVGLRSESIDLSFAAVVFAKGDYSVQAVSTDGVKGDQSLSAVALAQTQFNRLP